jgi:putative transposase
MKLVEIHIIRKGNKYFKEIDKLCFLSKNLYNKANYIIRQEFIKTSKEKENRLIEQAHWIRYNELNKMLMQDRDYTDLPRKVSQWVLKLLDKNWKSFFKSNKEYYKNPDKFNSRPGLPKYKDKTKGRNILIYTTQAISKTALKKGIIKLSGTNIEIKTNQKKICQVRIVPVTCGYKIEVVYEKEVEKRKNTKSKRIAGIDIGVNNLGVISTNDVNIKPVIINGRPLKSMNVYYNKKKSFLQSYIGDNGTSNRINRLTLKRNNKVNDYLHKTSRYIVNFLVSNDIDTVVIGKNNNWKQGINIGSANNQNFVSIPHTRLIEQIKYKAEMCGIKVKITGEEYTSKCSFPDRESIRKHKTYKGKRVNRGLFRTNDGLLVNADWNGSSNIIRKVFPNAFSRWDIGCVVHPLRITPILIN